MSELDWELAWSEIGLSRVGLTLSGGSIRSRMSRERVQMGVLIHVWEKEW